MPTLLTNPAFLPASSLFSGAGKLVDALLDDTFTDIYRLQPFDYAILVPYFAVLIVLEVRVMSVFAPWYCGPDSFGAVPYFVMIWP